MMTTCLIGLLAIPSSACQIRSTLVGFSFPGSYLATRPSAMTPFRARLLSIVRFSCRGRCPSYLAKV
jgi:hypothetical protein